MFTVDTPVALLPGKSGKSGLRLDPNFILMD
jgi:hypothetical protein